MTLGRLAQGSFLLRGSAMLCFPAIGQLGTRRENLQVQLPLGPALLSIVCVDCEGDRLDSAVNILVVDAASSFAFEPIQ